LPDRQPRARTGRGTPDVVIVGAAARDIAIADPRGWRLGGSVTYGSLLAARLGARVGALVGADAEAARAHELDLLRAAGVEIVLVDLSVGPVFDNIETAAGREQVGHAASDRLPAAALPERWRTCATFLLAPVAGEIGPEWADAVPRDALVGLAWQGLLRGITPGRPVEPLPPRPGPLIARADVGSVSIEDLRAGGGALDELLVRPGQELTITADAAGALHLVRRPRGFVIRRLPAVPARHTVDRTGAGDAFHTVWVLARMARGPLGAGPPGAGPPGAGPLGSGRALHLAALAGSLAVETVGLEGLPGRVDMARRIAEITRPRDGAR
jgi:sugar/nucleoside kinase (ribokinase family)